MQSEAHNSFSNDQTGELNNAQNEIRKLQEELRRLNVSLDAKCESASALSSQVGFLPAIITCPPRALT